MEEEKKDWKRFRNIKLDRKQFAKRVKKVETATQRHAHKFLLRRVENAKLVTREITIWLLIVGAMIAGLGVQLMWGQNGYMVRAQQQGGTYVEGTLGGIESLNPLFVTTSSEASVARLLFSSLYNHDVTSSLHQDLATGMEVSGEGTTYRVTIRDDVSWHDGTPLTAKDIVYTINLIKNPAVRSPLRVNWLDVAIKSVDSDTVEFTLPAPYAAFPYALTFPILPEHIMRTVAPGAVRESAFSRSPIGSGPFTFRRLQSSDALTNHKTVHLIANDSYYGGSPKLERMEIHAYQNEQSLLKAVRAGEINGAADLPITSKSAINANRYDAIPQALSSGVYLLLNNNHPVLKDKGVRKALQIGTDTKEIRSKLGGEVLPLDLPFLNEQVTGDDVPKAPLVDVAAAQKFLDEAGWVMSGSSRSKEGQKLEFTLTTTKNSEYDQVVQTLKKQWEKIGVSLIVKTVDTESVTSKFIQDTLQARNFDILLYELSIGSDPDVYAYWHSSQLGQTGYNFANYDNKTADASLASARARLEPELRNAKYKLFARQWLDDAPAIALYQPVVLYAVSKNVTAVSEGSSVVSSADRYANVLYWSVLIDDVYRTP